METPSENAVPQRLKVLVIAYYFPPMGGSGVQRITKFCKYLPEFGWDPIVLTVDPHGYYAYDETLLAELGDITVYRTPSHDVNRFFKKGQTIAMPSEQVRKKWSFLSSWTMIPDSKIGWKKEALEQGRKILQEHDIDLIFSTAPPFTAHLVAMELSKESGIPFVADFREAWLDNSRLHFPTGRHREKHRAMETEVATQATRITTINRGIKEGLLQRHIGADGYNTVQIIPHGYDPVDFPVKSRYMDGVMRFTYCGMFYDAQKPDTFLSGLYHFFKRRPEARKHVQAEFVGLTPAGAEQLAATLKIEDNVVFHGYLPHQEAVQHMIRADVLWMTLGEQPHVEKMSTSKLYEYFGAQKPIIGLVPEGEEATMIRQYGASQVVPPDNDAAVSKAIEHDYELWRKNALPSPDPAFVEKFDRRLLTRDLSKIFTGIVMNLATY